MSNLRFSTWKQTWRDNKRASDTNQPKPRDITSPLSYQWERLKHSITFLFFHLFSRSVIYTSTRWINEISSQCQWNSKQTLKEYTRWRLSASCFQVRSLTFHVPLRFACFRLYVCFDIRFLLHFDVPHRRLQIVSLTLLLIIQMHFSSSLHRHNKQAAFEFVSMGRTCRAF